jgi:hypothetical protein
VSTRHRGNVVLPPTRRNQVPGSPELACRPAHHATITGLLTEIGQTRSSLMPCLLKASFGGCSTRSGLSHKRVAMTRTSDNMKSSRYRRSLGSLCYYPPSGLSSLVLYHPGGLCPQCPSHIRLQRNVFLSTSFPALSDSAHNLPQN